MASSSQRSRSSGGGDTTTMACFPALLDDDLHQHGVLQEEAELRRGPWTVDEDITLVNYIADHGEGRWNSLARAAGLKRTGKSCRLRWLNYLRPDVKRGNFTADEQLLILDLHSRWGNRAQLRRYKSSVFLEDACMGCTKAARLFLELCPSFSLSVSLSLLLLACFCMDSCNCISLPRVCTRRWSKIAQHLPGRTDNEIKNYWRTRVQKHAKQLNCDASSSKLRDAMRHLWMPRLVDQRFQQAAGVHAPSGSASMDNSSMVTSSSDSFASEPYDVDLYADVLAGEMLHVGDWMQEPNQGLLSEATQDNSSQLQDTELTGWVQSFSEGLPENFWSLEDVWKMQ